MTQLVDAVVRGPMPYFSKEGVLFMPGQVVSGIPADEVTEDATRTVTVEVEAKNGDLRDKKVSVRSPFAPVSGAATIAGSADTSAVATGNPDRLNVSDFLKQGETEMVAAVRSGSVDDHLGAIEQQEIARKGPVRKGLTDAISARMAAMHRA